MHDEIVFKFFGECTKETYEYTDGLFTYSNRDFEITCSIGGDGFILLSTTLLGYYNKVGDCPIQILFPPDGKLSRRKEKRVFNLINHVLRNKGTTPTWGDIPGYDDFGRNNYLEFYKSHYVYKPKYR